MQQQVLRRAADIHGVVTGIGMPVFAPGIVIGEGAGVQRDFDVFGFAGSQLYALESFELLRRARDCGTGFGNVDLGYIGSGAGAGVGYVEGDGVIPRSWACSGLNLNMIVLERRIRKSVAEGE